MLQTSPILNIDGHDERRAFVEAAAKYARIDEALFRTPNLERLHKSISIRREALAIASLEGESAHQESLARLIGDADTTFIERGAKTAHDLYQAVNRSSNLTEKPSSEWISEIFKTSEASKSRLMKTDKIWTLEEDSSFVADLASHLAETPEPWLAVETIRRIWISGRFFGNARRIAMIIAPWCVATGFSGSYKLLGMTAALSKLLPELRNIEADPDMWAINYASAISKAAEEQLDLLGSVKGLVATMHSLCPPERASSSISEAINFFIAYPISSAKNFSQKLRLTPRGAKIVLDKMVSARLLDIEGGSRNRIYVSKRSL